MALRLTDTSPAPVPSVPSFPSAPAQFTVATGPQLVAEAKPALAVGDAPKLRALVACTNEIDDPHRRAAARQALVEEGLAQASQRTGAAAATAMFGAATIGLEVLTQTPAEPAIANLTAVALYEVGAYRGAEALFRAARDLDPTLPHVDANLRALKRARKAGVKIALPPHIAREVPAAGKRAEQLAPRARLSDPQTVALCMIVKDEERVLDRCLASAAPFVDEIVVVDTGSTDRTVEIAERHGARVLHHAWTDDFAEARNVGVDAATSDWILFLDADEWFEPAAAQQLKELTRKPWREGFRLPVHNRVGSERNATVVVHEALRLFRNRPLHRFRGRVHENVFHAIPGDRLEAGGAVRIEHDGYLATTQAEKGKQHRNLELLEQQVREEPTHFVHYNLGSEYLGLGRVADAVQQYERAWSLLLEDPTPAEQPFAPSLAARYADALSRNGKPAQAVAIAQRGLQLFPGFTDLVYVQSGAARAQGDLDRAKALLVECLELGDAPTKYVRQVGSGTYLAAIDLAGILAQQGELETAEQLLKQTLADHPEVLATIDPLATVMLARGEKPRQVEQAVADVLGDTPSTDVRFALASAFQAAGHPASAAAQLRALLA
ncbi:MAG TPA: glycosyltransferase, partial [Solirubrobacteraceae bacterium]|nr:glycosyltransferase [Solirubrobacteraceae bacterium]